MRPRLIRRHRPFGSWGLDARLGNGRFRVLAAGKAIEVPGDLAIAKSQVALKFFGPTEQNIALVKETEVAGFGSAAAAQGTVSSPTGYRVSHCFTTGRTLAKKTGPCSDRSQMNATWVLVCDSNGG